MDLRGFSATGMVLCVSSGRSAKSLVDLEDAPGPISHGTLERASIADEKTSSVHLFVPLKSIANHPD